ncbi:MAG: hypothetical protein U0900_07135 [Myxococcota bacterium]
MDSTAAPIPAQAPAKAGLEPGFVHACAALALALAALTRLPYFVGLDFPLNDGGLFLAMADAIRDAGFVLPERVDYNGHGLPFAYPPVAFYLTAILAQVFGIETLSVQLYLPLVFNLLTVVLFVYVAARLVDDRATLFFAAAAMPLNPRSYEWLIMGGGLTRSPGMFLAFVALALALRIRSAPDAAQRTRWAIACTIAMGLAFATHLEWGITAWVTTAVTLLCAERSRRQLALVVAMGFGIGLVSAPWWITVLARHGLDPFLAATATGGWENTSFFARIQSFDLFTRRNTWIGVFAAIGLGLSLHQRRFMPVIWLFAIWATTPRHGATAAVAPVSLMIGGAMAWLSDWTSRAIREAWQARRGAPSPSTDPAGFPLVHALAFIVLFACIANDTSEFHEFETLTPITAEERAGMAWIREHAGPDDRFLVVSSARDWAIDRVAEWFPVLAGRTASNTAQGLEWVHDGSFADVRIKGDVLRQVVNTSPSSAPIIGRKIFDGDHDYVAVFAEPGAPLIASYNASSRYELVHEQPHLSVYRIRTVLVSDVQPSSPPSGNP